MEGDVSYLVIGCAFKVHRHFGPGLFESVYERALMHELKKAGMQVQSQVPIEVVYDGEVLGEAFNLYYSYLVKIAKPKKFPAQGNAIFASQSYS